MPRIIMIHGITRKSTGIDNFYNLAPIFLEAGFSLIIPRYKFITFAVSGALHKVSQWIKTSLLLFTTPDDILLGYSNGGK